MFAYNFLICFKFSSRKYGKNKKNLFPKKQNGKGKGGGVDY